MRILGIETSCDETGIAVYDTDEGLLADALYSQVAVHAEYGGVVPELASRDHVRKTLPLIEQVLEDAGIAGQELDGIAYTAGPGLVGALMVGATLARSLALGWNIPALGDDAAGEAFDKTAKMLGEPYPGGPHVARLAETGNPARYNFPRPMINKPGLNFSFSGLKTHTLTTLREAGGRDAVDEQTRADIACAFQQAVVDTLVIKCKRALEQEGLDTLIIAGGVSANRELRERLSEELARLGGEVFYPAPRYCTDNGAMIAYAGAQRLLAGEVDAPNAPVRPRWPLEELPPLGGVA